MNNFKFTLPTRFYFGKGEERRTGEYLKTYGTRKVMIIHYGDFVKQTGLFDRITESIDAAGIPWVETSGVQPNPRVELVRECIRKAKEEKVDFLLAIGGGSVIDTAKATGAGMHYDGDVWELYEGKGHAAGMTNLGVVLTIPAAGSESNGGSVITNGALKMKRGYGEDFLRPKFAIMNPELTMTLPDYQTACGCTDIMMHTMERYFTNGGNMEITDSIAEALLRTVLANAKILMKEPDNYDARAEVMWAGSLAHNGLTGCGNDGGDFASHALEHEIGGMFDVAHGAGLAAIWGSWARYVYQDCLPRFKRYALNVMGVKEEGTDEEIALKGIEAMEDFYREIRMPVTIRELGIEPTDEQLQEMARKCAAACNNKKGSAKILKEEDMLAIYRMAL